MPVVVVIIIVATWVAILGPSLLRRRARAGGDQSITHFHYQLRVLEQRAPEALVAPAYRLRAVDGSGTPTSIHFADGDRPPVLTVVGAKELPRPALAFLGRSGAAAVEPVATSGGGPVPRHGSVEHGHADVHVDVDDDLERHGPPVLHAPTRGSDALTRAQARRRRQDTLTVLGAVFLVTLMAAAFTGSSLVWAVVALDGVALAAYVAVLVHLRRMAAEREAKLHYLDPLGDRPARSEVRRTYMSGRYAHPSNQQAVAR